MERIIIREVDNTSNVEMLSSYDVVYVPGFSKNGTPPVFDGQTRSLWRNPTLVTTKYEFLRLFGAGGVDDCPTFLTDQPYPIATQDTEGFPSYAIPNYVPPVEPTVVPDVSSFELDANLTEEEVIAAISDSGYYQEGFVASASWVPVETETYYRASKLVSEGSSTAVWTMSSIGPVDEQGTHAGKILFTSATSPAELSWKVKIGNEWVYSDDKNIEFNLDGEQETTVKTYYMDSYSPALMFRGPQSLGLGDADPGYRYALYLLSLGIPVYYEQMNCDFAEIDLTPYRMMSDEERKSVSPRELDWFVQVGNQFVRTTDGVGELDLNKVYYLGADISVESMYKGLEARFANRNDDTKTPSDYSFDSMGDYAVKYITSGGYPTFEYGVLSDPDASGKVYGTSGLAEQMIRLAADREDAVALIDHTNNPARSIYETDALSVVSRVREEFSNLDTITGSYGTMFTPWYNCTNTHITGGTSRNYLAQMPASLAFLSALAQQLKNYNPWLAVSGVSRGPVPYCSGLHINSNLTNNVADSYQFVPDDTNIGERNKGVSINPITYIRNYGYCIWGNRTLRNNTNGTQATSFLNIRDLTSDIKKALYEAAQSLMFEQNTDILWINFKSMITPLLDRMVSNYILTSYNITKYNVDPETGTPVPAYKVLANITIRPINSVEVFELQVTLENNNISVAEVE